MKHSLSLVLRGVFAGVYVFLVYSGVGFSEVASAQDERAYDDLQTYTLKINGVERSLGLYIPRSYSESRKSPLIVALHGRFSSAKALHALSQLQGLAEARGAILMYPEAVGAFWDDGGHSMLSRSEPVHDDASFIVKAVESLSIDYAVDRDRVFLIGYEGGGAMAYRLACQAPVRWAGAAVVSALMWQFTASACSSGGVPTSMMIVHGQESELFPVGGVPALPSAGSSRLSASATVSFWRSFDGCEGLPSAVGSHQSVVFSNCKAGVSVAYVGVPGAGHDWFRDQQDYRLNKHDLNAVRVIDQFFFDRPRFVLPSVRVSNEKPRDYLVYVPSRYNAERPAPILVMLHGRPSNAAAMARITNMNKTADRHGFIVVYPEGINNEWNAQFDLYARSSRSIVGGGKERAVLPQDDVGFLKNLMQDLRVDLNIDTQRMFVSGFSNGGFMTLRMACSASDTFAGFAEVGSALYTIISDFCKTGRPAPMLFMHGTADPSIPIGGVQISDLATGAQSRVTLSVKDTVAYFARRNHCEQLGNTTTFGESGRSPGTHVVRFVPHNCVARAPIVFYMIEGGGHTWPGVRGVMDEQQFGPVNMDIEASEVIWEFLSHQRLGN